MAKCIRCGKHGLFLKLDNNKMCADCALAVEQEKARQAEIERKEREERERIRQEQIRAKQELEARQIRFRVPVKQDNEYLLIKHATKNPDFKLSKTAIIDSYKTDERIYKYSFDNVNVEIVLEPDNKRAPDMQRVLINGDVIGTVPKDMRESVALALSSGIESIVAILDGGPSKIVREYLNENTFESKYSMFSDDEPLGCVILITRNK